MDASTWDDRYSATDLVWSGEPNMWVVDAVASSPPGRALDVAAGEGRNALWLAAQGWEVMATDFSPVAVDRARRLAGELDDEARARLTLAVGDATTAAPVEEQDLVILCYLHLPGAEWRSALEHAVAATAVGGRVVVVQHALRNLSEGVGGPQDPSILNDPEGVVESAEGLPVEVERSELRERAVEGHDRPALDTVVVFRRR